MWTTKASGLAQANLDDAVEDTRYTYNILGWLTGVTVVEKNDTPLAVGSEEQTVYGYDLQGRQLRIDLPGGAIQSSKLDLLGQVTQVQIYGPDKTPYDLGDNPIRSQFNYTIEDGQRTKLEETFYFDEDDNPATPDTPRTTTYDWSYDANDRLISEAIDHFEDDLDRTESFVMDLFGNRLSRTVDYAATSTLTDEAFAYLYDDNDRLITETLDEGNNGSIDKTTTYSWNATQQSAKSISASGAAVSTETLGYNLQGRLEEVIKETYTTGTVSSRTRAQYEYDSSDIRISVTESDDTNLNGTFESNETDNTTEYLVDHRNATGYAQTIVETTKDSSGQLVKRIAYTFGTDEITQTTTDYINGVAQPPVVHVFGHDAHGSVRVLLDALGALAQVYTYSAYGQLLAIHNQQGQAVGTVGALGLEAQALTTILYSGEFFDSRIGQQYLRARWYGANAGRFSRLDPYFGALKDPLSFNKYNYVHGNPISGVDPTGKFLASVSISVLAGAFNNSSKAISAQGVRRAAELTVATLSTASLSSLIYFARERSPVRGFAFGAQLGAGLYIALRTGNLRDVLVDGLQNGVTGGLRHLFGKGQEYLSYLINRQVNNGAQAPSLFADLEGTGFVFYERFSQGVFASATGDESKLDLGGDLLDAFLTSFLSDAVDAWLNDTPFDVQTALTGGAGAAFDLAISKFVSENPELDSDTARLGATAAIGIFYNSARGLVHELRQF